MNRRYVGQRVGFAAGGYVWVETIEDGAPVSRVPLVHRFRHSHDGFGWGYLGSGPADLALSILWDHLGSEPTVRAYQDFKRDHVANFDDTWQLDELAIGEWVDRHVREHLFATAADEEEFWSLDPYRSLQPVRPCCYCSEGLTYIAGRGWCHPDGDQVVRRCKQCDRRCRAHELAELRCRVCGGDLADDHIATPNHAAAG